MTSLQGNGVKFPDGSVQTTAFVPARVVQVSYAEGLQDNFQTNSTFCTQFTAPTNDILSITGLGGITFKRSGLCQILISMVFYQSSNNDASPLENTNHLRISDSNYTPLNKYYFYSTTGGACTTYGNNYYRPTTDFWNSGGNINLQPLFIYSSSLAVPANNAGTVVYGQNSLQINAIFPVSAGETIHVTYWGDNKGAVNSGGNFFVSLTNIIS